MTEISAAMVKELRDATSAGMMDCKRALQETGGDFDAAVKLLREKGMASAAKRADRETTEGIVLTRVDDDTAAIVAVGCETEPVSKNDDFRAFARRGARARCSSAARRRRSELEERRTELTARLGENIQIVGARRMSAGAGETFAAYVHPPANKVGVLLDVKRGAPELARAARDAHLLLAADVLVARRGAGRARRRASARSSRSCRRGRVEAGRRS